MCGDGVAMKGERVRETSSHLDNVWVVDSLNRCNLARQKLGEVAGRSLDMRRDEL
jgi:hypothetical protein